MGAPIIGITTYGRDEKGQYVLPSEYVESVRRAGGVPFLLPPGETRVDGWLAQIDALILAGGGDLDPARYGGELHETIYMLDEDRDATELELARRVASDGLPTLGICRGTQILNVSLGGTLHEHLPDVVGESILHRAPPREPIPHEVIVEGGTKLADIVGVLRFPAASWHHQAIDTVAPQLRVTARAPDGTIEAVEWVEHPWLIAVQWHPELTSAEDPIQQRLFDALARAAVEIGRGKR